MGDSNDLTKENVSGKDLKTIILEDINKKTKFPFELFVGKIENLVGNKVISYKRITSIMEDSLREIGKTSGEILEYIALLNESQEIAKRYFTAINYTETSRGYVLM